MIDNIFEWLAGVLYSFLNWIEGIISKSAIIDFSGEFATIWNMSTKVADEIFVPIGALFAVIYFFIKIADKVSFEQLTFEQSMKEIIKLVASLYLVINSCNIMVGCMNIGNGLLNSVMTYIDSEDLVYSQSQFETILKSAGDGYKLLAVLLFAIMFLVVLVFLILVGVIVQVVLLSRTTELAIKTAVAPLALCDTFNGDIMQSHAMAFIRSVLALALQGVFIAIILNFMPGFVQGSLEELLAGGNIFDALLDLIKLCAYFFVCLIMVLKSGSMAKDIMGAR